MMAFVHIADKHVFNYWFSLVLKLKYSNWWLRFITFVMNAAKSSELWTLVKNLCLSIVIFLYWRKCCSERTDISRKIDTTGYSPRYPTSFRLNLHFSLLLYLRPTCLAVTYWMKFLLTMLSSSLLFLVHTFNFESMKPDYPQVHAISELSTPQGTASMINYLGSFIKSFASKISLHWSQTKNYFTFCRSPFWF